MVLAAVLEPGPSRLRALRRVRQLRAGLPGQPVLDGGPEHGHPDRRRGSHRDAHRHRPRPHPGPEVPRPGDRAHPADHAVPGDARCRGAAVEDDPAGPDVRHRELGAAAVRHRALRLARPGAADLGHDRDDLAVDPVHDAAGPRRAAEPAQGHRGGRRRRRRRPLQIFRELTLPHLRRYIELGVVLGAIYLVNEFDAVYMMTQGGPGVSSTNLPFYIYQRAFLGFEVGQAAAMGVVVVVMTIIVATFALRLIFTSFSGTEQAA